MVIEPRQPNAKKKPKSSLTSAAGQRHGKASVKRVKLKIPVKELPKGLPPGKKKALVVGIGTVVIAIIAVVSFYVTNKKPEQTDRRPGSNLPPLVSVFDTPGDRTAPASTTPDATAARRPAIAAIRLTPSQPTRLDTLKAAVTLVDPAQKLTYTYRWKVNDRIVADAVGDSLPLANLKKRDLISVIVTPYEDGKAGFPVESPVIALYSVPPTLDLTASREVKKAGKAVELQLVSQHPDSNSITFGLDSPLIDGMTIDGRSGKITWSIQPGQTGKIRFGAFVEDADGTKVTKTFEVTVE